MQFYKPRLPIFGILQAIYRRAKKRHLWHAIKIMNGNDDNQDEQRTLKAVIGQLSCVPLLPSYLALDTVYRLWVSLSTFLADREEIF